MDISSSAPVSGAQTTQLRSNSNVNTQNSPQRVEQSQTAGRAQTAQTPRQPEQAAETPRSTRTDGDTYEAGSGAEVRAERTGGAERQNQANQAQTRDRENADRAQTAERNAYASNARTVQVQNEVLGTSVDVVR